MSLEELLEVKIRELREYSAISETEYQDALSEALSYKRKEDLDSSIQILKKLTVLRPGDHRGWHELGHSRYRKASSSRNHKTRMSQGARSLMAYSIAWELNQESVWSLHDMGNVMLHIYDDPVSAEKIYRECIEAAPGSSNTFYHDLGFSLFKQGRYDEAIEQYEKALELHEHNWTHHDLVRCYVRKGDHENMEKHERRAIELCINAEGMLKETIDELRGSEKSALDIRKVLGLQKERYETLMNSYGHDHMEEVARIDARLEKLDDHPEEESDRNYRNLVPQKIDDIMYKLDGTEKEREVKD